MEKILISVINYMNETEVLEFLRNLEKQSISSALNVVIINNKASISSEITLSDEIKKINNFSSITLLDPKENLGYLKGSFWGYEYYISLKGEKPDWFFISNTDIEIKDRHFFERFLSGQYNSEIWCVAPSVFSSKQKFFSNPYYLRRPSKNKIKRLIFVNEHLGLAFIYGNLSKIKKTILTPSKKNSGYSYAVHGSFFALRSDFMDTVKQTPYNGFLYGEELYIAELVLKNNKKCFYDSEIKIVHNENSVTSFLGLKKKSKFLVDSLKFILKTFYD